MNFLYTFPQIDRTSEGNLLLDWRGGNPYSQSHAVPTNTAIAYPQLMAGALSSAECDRVVALGEAASSPGNANRRADLVSRDYRVSNITWIEPVPEAQWLYHRLAVLFAQVNELYRFELIGFVEALQYTCYNASQYFNWHVDIGEDATERKLSLTIQLSEGSDYAGGDLQFHGSADMPVARSRGCATFFPSYLAHQVTPVTSGLRRSLVAWAYGPPFR